MSDAVRMWFRSITDVRRGERTTVALMATYGFLALTSYYIVKSVRTAAFIDRAGSEMLSFVYLLTAVFVILLMLLYSRFVDRIRERTLLIATFGLLGLLLLFFWWNLTEDAGTWVAWAFYVFSKLYGLLVVSQFWLVGNLLFTTRQARRLFGIIGLALILGGFAGGAIASALADLGSRTLVLLALAPLPICVVFVLLLSPHLRAGGEASARLVREFSGDAVRLLTGSPHLRNIAAVLALTILVGTLLDWQLGRAVDLYVPSEDGKTRFYGTFYGSLNIVSVGVQLLFTGFVLRRWGVRVALFALPLALLAASVAIVAVPVLLAVAFAKGAEGALRYSLDQSTRELLYLPVPNETLYKVKPLIDLAVYRGATGVGGLLLILATNVLGFGLRGVAVLSIAAIGLWVLVAIRMKGRYVVTLRQALADRATSAGEVLASVLNADSRPLVQEALDSGDRRRIAFALDLLDRGGPDDVRRVADDLHALLSSEEPGIRMRALEVLAVAPDRVDEPSIRPLLEDPDGRVRVAAVSAMIVRGRADGNSPVTDLLGSDDPVLRRAALSFLASDGPADGVEKSAVRDFFHARSSESSEASGEGRLEVAMAAGLLARDDEAARVAEFLGADPDERVASAALASLGRLRGPAATRTLVEALGRAGTREAASAALVALGPDAVSELVRHLNDPREDPAVRRAIPGVLAEIPTQETVDALVRSYDLPETDQWLDDRSLRALTRIRERDARRTGDRDSGALVFDAAEIDRAIERELTTATEYGAALATLDQAEADGPFIDLLRRTVEEARASRHESVFRWLELCQPAEDIQRCKRSLDRGGPRARANALEWLEHTVGHALFGRIRPAFVAPGGSPDSEASGSQPNWAPVRWLCEDEDRWVARCAMRAMREAGAANGDEIGDEIADETGDGPASAADPRAGSTAELDLVERVLLLRKVDLLGEVSPAHLALVASVAGEVGLAPDSRPVRKGAPPEAMYVLTYGELEVDVAPGRTRTIGPGDSIGGWALIDDVPSAFGARATSPTRALRIGREEFRDVVEEFPEVGLHLLAALGGRLRRLARQVTGDSARLDRPDHQPTVNGNVSAETS